MGHDPQKTPSGGDFLADEAHLAIRAVLGHVEEISGSLRDLDQRIGSMARDERTATVRNAARAFRRLENAAQYSAFVFEWLVDGHASPDTPTTLPAASIGKVRRWAPLAHSTSATRPMPPTIS